MSDQLEFPALKIRQPIGEFFIASLPAKKVAEVSYSDVRRMSKERDVERYLGVQRPLSEKRVKEIKRYVKESPDATFPTSVILAVDEKCVEFDEDSGVLRLTPFVPGPDDDSDPIPYPKIAKVLDGQHRIAGFTEDGNNLVFDDTAFSDEFDLSVSIFVGADIPLQANIFATVNLAQTKVNKSLAYDLYALSKTQSPYKTCHEVAVVLDTHDGSPFEKRIKRLGVKTPGRVEKEPLTLQAFVESLLPFISGDPMSDRNAFLDGTTVPRASGEELVTRPFRNLFIDGKSEVIAFFVYRYFKAVQKRWPDAWGDVNSAGNLLPKANAFKAFMRFLREEGVHRLVKGEVVESNMPSVSDFYSLFEKIELEDSDFNATNLPPGSSGQSALYKILTGEISKLSDLG